MEMVDLSRVIYNGMPKIPILPEVQVGRCFSLDKGAPLNVTQISLACHAGTHVDAPIHIVPNGKSIEELSLDAFVGPGAVIPVKKKGGHPYLSVDAAEWMVEKEIKLFGIDCITVDLPTPLRPKGFDFPVHRELLGNGVLIAENVANLGRIVGKKTRIMAFPLRVKGSDAGHARIVAEILN